MFKNYFLTTIRTLRQNPLYTALSVFGIALTFVFVCVLLLIAESSKTEFIPKKYAERTWFLPTIDNGRGSNSNITREHIEMWLPKMTTPEIMVVNTRNVEESVIVNNKSKFLMVMGVSDQYFDVVSFKFLCGRPMNRQEITEGIPVAVLAKNFADLYFGRNEDPIGKIFELKGIQCRIVGVVEDPSLFGVDNGFTFANMWIPLETIKRLNNRAVRYQILFTGKDKASIAEMQEELTRVLGETNSADGIQWRIPSWQKRTVEQRNALLPGMGILTICLILMLIPALNILSLNVCKSYDRSEEIAVRRAFGAPISTIFAQLFFENFLLTLAGAVVGMCITPPILNLIDKAMLDISILPVTLSLHFDLKTILLVVGPCVLVFSFFSGSIPAWITAKRNIVNVLKGEAQ